MTRMAKKSLNTAMKMVKTISLKTQAAMTTRRVRDRRKSARESELATESRASACAYSKTSLLLFAPIRLYCDSNLSQNQHISELGHF
jgi:uncharacterized membrane protein YhaH (DUF805 family)